MLKRNKSFARRRYTGLVPTIIGLVGFIGSIATGIYVGLWELFIKRGIIAFVDAIKQPVIDSGDIGLSILNLIIASPVGWLVAIICMGITAFIAGIFD